jgi:hypothetical protein
MTAHTWSDKDPDARWTDRLVELHVLAEHGDAASAAAADQWMAADVRAREVWTTVESVRDQLREVAGTGHEPTTGER